MSRVRVPFPAPFPATTSAMRADVAQSVERVLGKDEVTSSILVIGSSKQGNPGAWAAPVPVAGAVTRCQGIASHLSARCVAVATTRLRRTAGLIRTGSSIGSTVPTADGRPCTGRRGRPVAQSGRAPVSKTGGCRFKSCRACQDHQRGGMRGSHRNPDSGCSTS